jgi:hypothetical protein
MKTWMRALGLFGLAVLAALVVTGAGSAAAPPAPSAAVGQFIVPPWEIAPEPGTDADEGDGASDIANAPYIDPQHRSDVGGGGGGSGGGGSGGVSGAGFAGLTLIDQRTADGGNQQTVSPPDQGLCTNGFQVLEAVNTVFKVYSPNGGSQSGVQPYVPFFFPGQHQVNRTTTPPTYGPFVSDPKCYFDTGTLRWFMTLLEIDRNPATGAFGTTSHLLIAVSKTPLATTNRNAWWQYSVDTTADTDAAASPVAGPCPCFGDQPLIGADAYGFFVTTNSFPIVGAGFNGSQIYAFSKRKLANGQLQTVRLPTGNPFAGEAGGIPYSVQPATSPTPFDWDTSNHGTEYLEQALEFVGAGDTRIGLWKIINTRSLDTATPAPVLVPPAIVTTEPYAGPVPAVQAPGPYPLGQFLGDPEETLNTNDDRMNQVTFARGLLYSGLNTIYSTTPTPTPSTVSTAAAWFIVKAKTAQIANQGYVAIRDGSAYFPSIALNHDGEAAITFSYSGTHDYPSAGYATLDAFRGLGPLKTLAAGQKPSDDFSGYPQLAPGDPNAAHFTARWGDYSAATADAFGNLWFATEWIPGTFGFIPPSTAPPSFIANWGTAVGRVNR